MFPQSWTDEGHGLISDTIFLYILKTVHFFEQLVRESASEQRVPVEILRVLKECRVCVIVTNDSFFLVGAYVGDNDSFKHVIHTEDFRSRSLLIKEAEQIGAKRIFSRGPIVDPLTLRFPIESLDSDEEQKRALLIPIAQRYIVFELSWAKQRGIITIPKPFFPGKDFVIDKELIFVLMPFISEFNEIFSECVKPIVEKYVCNCVKADDIFHNRPIVEVIWENINKARLIIADLTGRNPNVFYEIGMAHTLGKEVILLSQQLDDIPFDLRHLNVIRYQWTPPGAKKLQATLDATIKTVIEKNS